MKKSIQSLIAVAVFGALSLAASAQPAVKILVVDMAKLYDSHYKTVDQNAKIQADDAKANEEVEKMNKEGNALVEEYKSLADQAGNPTITAEAKAKTQADAQKKYQAIEAKQREVQGFIQQTRQSLNQRLNTFRALMLEEISKLAADVGKRKGATLLLDKAGPSGIGISNVVYFDPAYDITDDVLKEINKDRPVTAPAAAPAPGAAAPAAPASGGITVPGLTPTKK
jgi:outer membrane protein